MATSNCKKYKPHIKFQQLFSLDISRVRFNFSKVIREFFENKFKIDLKGSQPWWGNKDNFSLKGHKRP